MYNRNKISFFIFLLFSHFCYSQKQNIAATHKYYFSAVGNDNNDGSINHPLQTINKLNNLHLQIGDEIYFHGGDTFNGTIYIDSTEIGSLHHNILISSYGKKKAIINSANEIAFLLHKTKYIKIKKITFIGSGRKNGNTKDGVKVDSCNDIFITNIEISGFQKAGLMIYSSSNIKATNVNAYENGAAGISVDGPYSKKESNHNIYIGYCIAENNPGDPTNFNNHSGNGIVVGSCRKVLIEYCTATNNGWDMPRIGNGPVGIWAYEADSVIIQHCLSYRNKTSVGGADGGGFDLDGGVTNSLIQYCFSYENHGAGYSIFQYLYATPWYNNIYRFNISENDGSVSDSKAGAYIWNSSRDSNQFYNCFFYNNTIYNAKGTAITYSELSERKSFYFFNNIFVAEDSLIKGEKGVDVFRGNDWWSLTKKFSIEGVFDFKKWANQSGQEKLSGKIIGLNINPHFKNPANATFTKAIDLSCFSNYQLPQNSLLRESGINLSNQYKMHRGKIDFLYKRISSKGIGACL